MRAFRLIFLLLALLTPLFSQSQTLDELDVLRIRLPNGWSLTPVGKSLPLGDLPLNLALSPDGKYLAVTNNGQSVQSIQLIDVARQEVVDSREVPVAWYGLAWADDSQSLFASGGNGNYLMYFLVRNGKLQEGGGIALGDPWPERISVAGIAFDDQRDLLYAVTKENNSLYVASLKEQKVLHQFPLGGEGYSCVLSPDKKTLYASCWGCDKVVLFNTEAMQPAGVIPVGDNPNELLLSRDGDFLFVANANDNTVSVIDTEKRLVVETLNTALFPDAPSGSTTNGMALSEDGKTLYIANADNNCLAVFDISKPGACKSKGFIPTGWYPTSVKVVNKTLFVANGKGFTSLPNPKGPNPNREWQEGEQYIGGLFKGTLSIIPEPKTAQLGVYSQAVYRNSPYTKEKEMQASGMAGNPIPTKVGDPSPIRYVFYVIKENRTYDQVLSDIPEGNGDTSLLLFGEKITPNQHALAREFVLLDNFYVDGEVSADGHNWSLGAYATDYLEKNWPTNYSGRGGSYDAEGTREVANNKHFLWDLCKKYGVSYRTYGEFADDYKANIPVLEDHFCPYYTSWDESVMDTTRFRQWRQDFDSLLAIGQVPQLNTLRFINDHTEGLRLGRPSPFAHVADNDLAVGLFVEYLSQTPIWEETAIFIVEDDAQNGPDHVDAHRTTAYLAGGYVKRHFVDHTMYSTSGMLRTIELILGLPPMSQYDAAAEPMWRCFSDKPDVTPYKAIPAQVDLFEVNTALNEWQRKSEEFDFRKEDSIPDEEFNRVIWYAVKGDAVPCPPPVRAAFLAADED